MNENPMHPLQPRRTRGCPTDYYQAPREIGVVLVAIFNDPDRNNGMPLQYPDWRAVYCFLGCRRENVGDAV